MARKPPDQRIQKIYQTVRTNPGARPSLIARLLGLHRSEVTRSLPALEERGLYLSEDEGGGLWPFNKRKE